MKWEFDKVGLEGGYIGKKDEMKGSEEKLLMRKKGKLEKMKWCK